MEQTTAVLTSSVRGWSLGAEGGVAGTTVRRYSSGQGRRELLVGGGDGEGRGGGVRIGGGGGRRQGLWAASGGDSALGGGGGARRQGLWAASVQGGGRNAQTADKRRSIKDIYAK